MALYKYTTKAGQFYGVRFRVVEADGVERHKNLRGFTTQRAARQAQYEYERENSAHLVQKKRDKRVLPVPFCYSFFNFSAERRTNSACVSPCFLSRASISAASPFCRWALKLTQRPFVFCWYLASARFWASVLAIFSTLSINSEKRCFVNYKRFNFFSFDFVAVLVNFNFKN